MKKVLNDVLAERYASSAMVDIWSPEYKVRLERELWVAALKSLGQLGMDIPDEAISAYEAARAIIDLESIKQRELKTRHDIKARIEEFNSLAGFELVHLGFTSRDLSDNVEQLQIKRSLEHVRNRAVAVLARLVKRAEEFEALALCGRSHNIPGQTITLGKRFANFANELSIGFGELEHFIAWYPLRGIKGPMGTQQDMLDLLGDPEKVAEFEDGIEHYLGFDYLLESVGQVYPRSLDFSAVSTLQTLAAPLGNFAKMVRLMAGDELLHEGFGAEQSGSSAMPHKMNSRTCERINGLLLVLGGFADMLKGLLGDQWYEGDVSCSVVRRVALPGAFFAIDGILESTMTVLDEMQVFPSMIERELAHYLPFLSTTRILMAAVKKGIGRETAHKAIKKAAVAAIGLMRDGSASTNPFLDLLTHSELGLTQEELGALTAQPDYGLSREQVRDVCSKAKTILKHHWPVVDYKPEPIL